MPELPEITVYQERLRGLLVGHELRGTRLKSHFLLRSVAPPLEALHGRQLVDVGRSGKQLLLEFSGEHFAVIHLMISGRLRLRAVGAPLGNRAALLAFDFAHGSLVWTEASSKKRSSLHLVVGRSGLDEFDRGGLEVLGASIEQFAATLARENRTLKRALTDPRLFSGIGNAFSDEILHRARLSPVKLTSRLDADETERLHAATQTVLDSWIERMRTEVGDGFPDSFTAAKQGMAVHGRYRQPCPDCGRPVQRIRYAENECNYCAVCQNAGRLLADRGLSQLMHRDWPKTLAELEERRRGTSDTEAPRADGP
ncbi:MAG: formamidopyrimidine-DNA glycosylase [Planctomycetes bacterium]|nr:formamidopyrimidine-DNA glycosylase [Planctomycetota bacterium]MCB9869334.1 formamidopyrimidine-DNA glycosylase [Planctomycetota bacterium]